jgi:pimeloyl-ACP methyl ester carboxylesterase
VFSDNPLFETFAQRSLIRVRGGGVEVGEIMTAIGTIADGGTDAWVSTFTDLAARVSTQGETSAAAGHRVSARDSYLRASTYFDLAYWPIYGSPVDPRLTAAAARADEAFAKAMELVDHYAQSMEIEVEGLAMPAWFLAPDSSGTARRTIIHTNGYDSNVHEMYFAHALAALDRGWNVVLFDGPGQGRCLIRDGASLRPDWETVVGPVLDATAAREDVAEDSIVLAGWSLGGFLAPRAAATHADRLAALVADPGQWDQRDNVVGMLPLSDEEKAAFPDVDLTKLDPIQQWLDSPDVDPVMKWRIVQRGFWVNGVPDFASYAVEMCRFVVSDRASRITCPTVVTRALADPLAKNADKLFEAIGSSKKVLIEFTDDDGAGGHCETLNRSLYHQRVYDWLDDVVPASR